MTLSIFIISLSRHSSFMSFCVHKSGPVRTIKISIFYGRKLPQKWLPYLFSDNAHTPKATFVGLTKIIWRVRCADIEKRTYNQKMR